MDTLAENSVYVAFVAVELKQAGLAWCRLFLTTAILSDI